MSVKWISYFWDKTDYKEGELLTALALADFADDSGFCYPFIEQLAHKARLGIRQIQRILRHFEADGLLEITRFQGRGKRPQFQLKKVTSTTPFRDREKVTSTTPFTEIKGDICDKKKVTSTTFPPTPPYKEYKPSLKPSLKTLGGGGPGLDYQAAKGNGKPPTADCSFEKKRFPRKIPSQKDWLAGLQEVYPHLDIGTVFADYENGKNGKYKYTPTREGFEKWLTEQWILLEKPKPEPTKTDEEILAELKAKKMREKQNGI